MQVLDTRYGRLRVPDADSDVIGAFLRAYGEWSWLETSFVAETLPPGARVLDVGAFVGTFSLGLAAQVELGYVCAVEANPRVAALLAANLDEYLTVPHAVIAAAVAPVGVRFGAGHSQPGNLGSLSFASNASGDAAAAPDEQTTMERLREEHGPFDLVKMDVEGLERDLLRSDEPALRDGQTAVWVECNEDAASLRVAELLLVWGVPVYYVAWPSHNPSNAHGREDALLPFAYEAALLARPAREPELRAELSAAGCVLARIDDVEGLRRAMWRTPRWAPAAWAGRPLPEVVALAGHDVLQHSYDDYLADGWDPQTASGNHLRDLRMAFEDAERLAYERLGEVQAQQARVADLERGLQAAQELALERLAAVEELQRRVDRAERQLAAVQVRLLDQLAGGAVDPAAPGAVAP